MTHNTCSSDLCESVSVVGARQVDVSMLKRLLSPRSESLEPMAASCLETTFDAVVDAQSQHYAVPALALASVTKKIQNFFKVVAVVMDKKRNRMWCEAIGSQGEMDTLVKTLQGGNILLFSKLCFKRSPWHSGGKFLDLSKKQQVKVEHLKPVHSAYQTLQAIRKDGPATFGTIDGLRGLERGHKADLTGRVCSIETKILRDTQDSWCSKHMTCMKIDRVSEGQDVVL